MSVDLVTVCHSSFVRRDPHYFANSQSAIKCARSAKLKMRRKLATHFLTINAIDLHVIFVGWLAT